MDYFWIIFWIVLWYLVGFISMAIFIWKTAVRVITLEDLFAALIFGAGGLFTALHLAMQCSDSIVIWRKK